jgi:hypothetical protein
MCAARDGGAKQQTSEDSYTAPSKALGRRRQAAPATAAALRSHGWLAVTGTSPVPGSHGSCRDAHGNGHFHSKQRPCISSQPYLTAIYDTDKQSGRIDRGADAHSRRRSHGPGGCHCLINSTAGSPDSGSDPSRGC